MMKKLFSMNCRTKKFLIFKKYFGNFRSCFKLLCLKESLKLKDVFRPKIRGQHGAGIEIEPKITKNFSNFGSSDMKICIF